MQPTTTYISVPKGLPSQLVKNTRELKAMAVWYQLKAVRVCGVIKDFGRHAKAIAAVFGYSERKLRTYVQYLRAKGYIEKSNRHDLVLRASRLAGKTYGVAKTYYRIPTHRLHQLELELRALALQENLERQQFTLRRKLQDQYLRDSGITTPSHLQPAARRRALRGYDSAKMQATVSQHVAREQQSASTPACKPTLNPFVTLSRQGIARALGRRSKATGVRYARKLQACGLLTETKHQLFVCDASLQEFGFMREAGFDHTYRFTNGQVFKSLPNQLTIRPSLMA